MKRTSRRTLLTSCTLLAFTLGLTASPADAENASEAIAVVVGQESSIDELSLYELKRLYLGNDVRVEGMKALPLNRSTKTSEREGFDESVLGMSPEYAARYWIDQRIRGKKGPPRAVEPAGVVKRAVAKIPQALGYVRLSDVDGSVKIVRIDGKAPGDTGYPVRAPR